MCTCEEPSASLTAWSCARPTLWRFLFRFPRLASPNSSFSVDQGSSVLFCFWCSQGAVRKARAGEAGRALGEAGGGGGAKGVRLPGCAFGGGGGVKLD